MNPDFNPQLPVRISFRTRGDAIHAILCLNEPGAEDSEDDAYVISTLALTCAQQDRLLFEQWKEAMKNHLVRFVQSVTGAKVACVQQTNLDPKPEN